MKKILLALLLLTTAIITKGQTTTTTAAQNDTAPGPAEQKLLNSLCDELGKIDISTLHTKEEATNAFMTAFASQADKLVEVATERGIELTDQSAMHNLGLKIGVELLKQNCTAFLKLSTVMAGNKIQNNENVLATSIGTFKRVDNKGFLYIVITDSKGIQQSFIWLRPFPGSEKLMANPTTALTGKKLMVTSRDIEVYVPAAKGYFKVKEITGIEIL